MLCLAGLFGLPYWLDLLACHISLTYWLDPLACPNLV